MYLSFGILKTNFLHYCLQWGGFKYFLHIANFPNENLPD